MNPKHITYSTRSNSHGQEETPIFLQSVTHMDCSPYWYRFFIKKLPPRPWPLTINGRPFTIASNPTEDLPLTPGIGVYHERAQGMTSLFQHIEPQALNTNIYVWEPGPTYLCKHRCTPRSFPGDLAASDGSRCNGDVFQSSRLSGSYGGHADHGPKDRDYRGRRDRPEVEGGPASWLRCLL